MNLLKHWPYWLLLILLAVIAALQYRLWFAEGGLSDNRQLKNRLDAQQTVNAKISASNQLLADEITALKTGSDEIESRARQNLGLVKKDETFFLLLEEPESKTTKSVKRE